MAPVVAERVRNIDRAVGTPRAAAPWRSPAEVDNARGIDLDRDIGRGATDAPEQPTDARGLSEGQRKNLRHRNDCYETARRAARWSKTLGEVPHCAEN